MNIKFRADAGGVLEGRPAPSGTAGVGAIPLPRARLLFCRQTARDAAQARADGARHRAEWGPATGFSPSWGAREPRLELHVAMRRFSPSNARGKP